MRVFAYPETWQALHTWCGALNQSNPWLTDVVNDLIGDVLSEVLVKA